MKSLTTGLTFAAAMAALVLTAPGTARAADAATGTGIGIIAGDPSGFSLKIPQGRSNAVHAVIGYDLFGGRGPGGEFSGSHFYAGADYVWYNYNLFPVKKGRLPLYYGPGAFASISGNSSLGIRGVVGLEYQFAGAPFDVFLEIGPRINVIPDTRGGSFGGFGGRFFF